MTTDKLQ